MKKYQIKNFTILLYISLFFSVSNLFAQTFFSDTFKTTFIEIEKLRTSYVISDKPIIPLSEKVMADTLLLIKNIDYEIDYQNAQITLKHPGGFQSLLIIYAFYPESLQIYAKKYTIETYSDSLITKKKKQDLFAGFNQKSKLNISGNKTFSVSVSNQQDVDINQSLYLKLDGEISENVRIEAQLNDSQSPLSEEGDTKELSSLDQVFFKVYSPHYEIAFGDLDMKFEGTNFINYTNKFEGVRAGYQDKSTIRAALALSKSKNAEIDFFSQNGKQGPYYLKPSGSAYNVKIISGTEEIALDGILLSRGEDYLIDYAEGTITFTSAWFISSNNRIKASFQYSDDNYRKNLYLTQTKNYFNDRFYLFTHSIMQSDDKKNPLEASFTDADLELLKNSGDQSIFVDGAVYVGPGLGSYRKVFYDDLFYYEYSTDTTAVYNVYFTYIGGNAGSYRQTGTGRYEYVGQNQGDWVPLRKLTAPVFKANWDVIAGYNSDLIQMQYEALISDYDKNTFSTKDSEDDLSLIQNMQMTYNPDYDLLNPVLNLQFRQKLKNLMTFSSYSAVDDYQFYQLNLPDTLANEDYQIKLKTDNGKGVTDEFSYRFIHSKDYSNQYRFSFSHSSKQKKLIPYLSFQWGTGKQDFDEPTDPASNLNMTREQQKSFSDLTMGYLIKKADVKQIFRQNRFISEEDTLSTGQRLMSQQTLFSLKDWKNLTTSLSFLKERNDVLSQSWNNLNIIQTYSFNSLISSAQQTSQISFSHRLIDWNNPSQGDQKFDLIEVRSNQKILDDFIQANINYSINNLEFYPKIRELQYVGEEVGIYDSTGVVAEDGEYDYVYIQSGAPQQTTEVKNDLNLFINPGSVFQEEIARKTQLETWVLVNENSRYKNKYRIYVMDPDHLMNDSTSVYSKLIFRQSLWYNLLPSKVLIKYSYLNDQTLDNRYQSPARNKLYDHEFSFRLINLIKNDWEILLNNGKEYDSRYETNTEKKSLKIISKYNLSGQVVFTTEQNTGHEVTDYNQTGTESRLLKLGIIEDVLVFIGTKYRFNCRFEFAHNNRSGSEYSYTSADKKRGQTYKWNSSLYYKMNNYTSLNAEYSGYDYPNQKIWHQLKLEIKAEF